MRISELLRLVWQNITQNKFKTVMTSIGIIVGAATIVMVIAIGKGGQMDVADQFKNLNAGAIDISCQVETQQGFGGFSGGRGGPDGGGGMPSGGSSGKSGSSSGSKGSSSSGSSKSSGGDFSGGGGMPPTQGSTGGNADGGSSGGGNSGNGNADGGSSGGGNSGNGNVNGENSGSQPDADGNSGMGTPPQGMKMPSQDASSGENFTPPDDGMDFPGASMDDSADLEQVTLTQEDAEYLLENTNDISDATISYTTRAGVDGGDLEEETVYSIAGVQANYASLSNLTLSVGEFISEEENGNKEKNCILGAGAAEEIFGSAIEAYGSILYIDQRIYVVDGVLEEMGSVSSGISPDDTIFIPYETGIKYLVGENVSPTLTIIAEDVEQIDTVIAEATEVLAESYPNSEFTFSDAGSKMEAASASNQILTMLLVAMAVIVFVVGGIGIMNVLFVSVKERTNEIGILKAIGCSRKNILLEFLLEASAISFLGGVLGIVASLLITPIVQQFDVRVELSATAFLAALGFAVITGTIFGFYPAFKASKLVPVEALNAE